MGFGGGVALARILRRSKGFVAAIDVSGVMVAAAFVAR